MLGAIAFIITSIIVGFFSYSLHKLLREPRTILLTVAYLLLAATFLIFGISAATKDTSNVTHAILAGNLILVWASTLVIAYRTKLSIIESLVAGLFTGLFALLIRRIYFYPTPELKDGILLFNTQMAVGIFLGVIFLFAWLPVNLAIAREISHQMKLSEARIIYSGLFTAMVCSALLFLAVRSSTGVILSFAVIATTFLSLTVLNLFAHTVIGERKNGK